MKSRRSRAPALPSFGPASVPTLDELQSLQFPVHLLDTLRLQAQHDDNLIITPEEQWQRSRES